MVHGLPEYFQNGDCPDEVCREVHLPSFFEAEIGQRNGHRPTVVIHVNSCFSMWLEDSDCTTGSEPHELLESLRSFVQDLRDCGVKFVFFAGGVASAENRKLWLDSQIENIDDVKTVWDQLCGDGEMDDDQASIDEEIYDDQASLDDEIDEDLVPLPPNIEIIVIMILKYVLKCEVYIAVEDCFQEIVEYVRGNCNCIAIFADNTDFVVSNIGTCLVLDAGEYDTESKTTLLYDRQQLSQHLDIPLNRLPLLGILAGNDFIDSQSLQNFHGRLCDQPEKLMEDLANYLYELPERLYTRPDPNTLLRRICNDMFGNCNRVGDLKKAYYHFVPCRNSELVVSGTGEWVQILRKAKELAQNVFLPVPIWTILKDQVYEMALGMENLFELNNSNLEVDRRPSATLTRSLRRRLYGILLNQIRGTKPEPVVAEWCGENPGSYKEPVKVKPTYPQVYHPGLKALWDPRRNNTLREHKWDLFLECISTEIDNIRLWQSLDKHLVVPAAALYYLYKDQSFLDVKELRAIQVTLALYTHYDCEALDQLPEMTSYEYDDLCEATRLSELFCQTYHIVFLILGACGYPVPLSERTAHIKFEPKLFHMIYDKVQNEQDTPIDYLCDYHEDVEETFNKLKRTITHSRSRRN